MISCGTIRYDATEPPNTEQYNNASYENDGPAENVLSESEFLEIVPNLPRGKKAQCCIGSTFKLYQGKVWLRERYSEISMGVCFENSTSTRITSQLKNEFRVAKNIISRHPKNRLITFVLRDTKNTALAQERINLSERYLLRIGLPKNQIIIR
ncbi:MAG: hypothetical protein HQ536_00050 [Parcubacteria group bacterium]|nr:hypothetical protein [Parcubacteria group bacterium]